jgi:hypothetical protein
VTGGAAVTICRAGAVLGLSWAHDGSILFGQEQGAKGILRVPANGGTPEVVVAVKGREDAHGPQLLPDGEHVLFTLATGTGGGRWDTAQIAVQSLKTGARKTLVNGGTDGRYLATGHIVYGLSSVLYAVPFDAQRLALTGEPVPLVEGVRASGALSGSMQFSVSNTGSLVYIPGRGLAVSDQVELGLIDRNGVVERLKLPTGAYANPRVSPDGKRVAVAIADGKGSDVWIYDLSGASPIRRLTFVGRNRLPIWSPDSQRIAFQSDREADEAIFVTSCSARRRVRTSRCGRCRRRTGRRRCSAACSRRSLRTPCSRPMAAGWRTRPPKAREGFWCSPSRRPAPSTRSPQAESIRSGRPTARN